MPGRPLLAVLGWLATAVAALLIGLAAIRLVGESISGTPGGVRSQEEVRRALAATPFGAGTTPPAAGPTPPGVAVTSAAGARRGLATTGGTAVAECGPSGVRLVSWAPAQGYRVRDVDRGPDEHVEVRFAGPAGEDELRVVCVGSPPVPQRRH
ncbi:septum formation initiator [Micromonospora sp. CPCC 206171]|uniref:septum formation initiator n=1 Tax=Micromonospora sp. CPCC 206171 TaxID=3122405 RepID=UPI002FEF1CD8